MRRADADTAEYLSEDTRTVLDEMLSSFKSAKSRKNYENAVLSICRDRKKDFTELGGADIQSHFSALRESGAKENSVYSKYRMLCSVAAYFDTAAGTSLRSGFVNALDIFELPDPRYVNDPGIVDRVDLVLTFLREKNDRKTFALIALALETGLSTGDILSLRICDLGTDRSSSRPFLFLPKKDEEGINRYIPLKKGTAEILSEVGKENPYAKAGDSLFLNSKGSPLDERTAERWVHDACMNVGLKKESTFTLESLAVIARAAMLNGGCPVPALTYQLGIDASWFFRVENIDLSEKAASFNHITVNWQEKKR